MTTYLFDSDKLYYKSPALPNFAHRKVEPRTLRCHNVTVRRLTANDWLYEFQIVGGDDTWFFTRYDWALIVDSPENLSYVARAEHLQTELEQVMRVQRAAQARIQNVRTVYEANRE